MTRCGEYDRSNFTGSAKLRSKSGRVYCLYLLDLRPIARSGTLFLVIGFLISAVNYSGTCLSRFNCCGSGLLGAVTGLGVATLPPASGNSMRKRAPNIAMELSLHNPP